MFDVEMYAVSDPGYEAIKIAGSPQKPNVHSSDVGQKKTNQSTPFLTTSLNASGDHGNSINQAADELQIPQSARSTLSGRSWLGDSKWSDDEDENDESVGGPSSVHPGAIPKTSTPASMSTSLKNNNNSTTKTMKTTNLTAAATATTLAAESNRNDNNNQVNLGLFLVTKLTTNYNIIVLSQLVSERPGRHVEVAGSSE